MLFFLWKYSLHIYLTILIEPYFEIPGIIFTNAKLFKKKKKKKQNYNPNCFYLNLIRSFTYPYKPQ